MQRPVCLAFVLIVSASEFVLVLLFVLLEVVAVFVALVVVG